MALEDNYMTITQAAAMLWVARETVRRWIANGKLRGYPMGKITLVERTQVLLITTERGIDPSIPMR